MLERFLLPFLLFYGKKEKFSNNDNDSKNENDIDEEKDIYTDVTKSNTKIDNNHLVNVFLVFFIGILIVSFVYIVFYWLTKSKFTKLENINYDYDGVLKEIKKTKIKKTFKLKKGSLFRFLDKK